MMHCKLSSEDSKMRRYEVVILNLSSVAYAL